MTRPTLRPTQRIAAAATAALLPLGMLAGCGEDDPQPTSEDPASAEPSDSDSESPEEPVEPEPPAAMDGDDEAAAQAFVEYYFAVWDYAVATGRVRPLRELALPTCSTCHSVSDAIEETLNNGGTVTGGDHTVERARFTRPSTRGDTRIFQGNARISNTTQTIRRSGDPQLDGRYPSGTVTYGLVVIYDNGWRMSEWRLLSPQRG